MKNIECEIRSFLTEQEYHALMKRLKKEATFLSEDEQITYYFDSEEDLRIQKNKLFSKIWLKKGNIHDEHREELEIQVPRDDFEKLEKLFMALGYTVSIQWFRKRHTFVWGDIKVMLDFTRGYGYILELEKVVSPEEQESTVEHLKTLMQKLGITLTPKEEFDTKYQHYKKHWRKLV